MRTLRPTLLHASRAAAFALAAAGIAACNPDRPSGSSGDAGPGPAGSSSASIEAPAPASPAGAAPAPGRSASGAPRASASAEDEEAPLQILRLTFTSNVRDKEPADKLESAKPGQRVWAHINLRNRSGSTREIDLVFRVNGKERSRVPLDIQSSWSYRTWGYVTLRPADTSGEVTVTVIDDSGEEISSARLPIRP